MGHVKKSQDGSSLKDLPTQLWKHKTFHNKVVHVALQRTDSLQVHCPRLL